jgi:hypothetical protein
MATVSERLGKAKEVKKDLEIGGMAKKLTSRSSGKWAKQLPDTVRREKPRSTALRAPASSSYATGRSGQS